MTRWLESTTDIGQPGRTGRASLFALAAFMLALAVVAVAYRSSYFSLIQKWSDDAAFSHGFLILPICAWLAWRQRRELAGVVFEPSVWGVLAVAVCALVWLVARGSGILVVEQFAAVALIPALVLAALGWPATRVLAFPLAFLFFVVPFGRGLVPTLMQSTADFATLLLNWSGVPVFRSHMHISIPAGDFEVARACSGLNYLITGVVLGVLYANLNFHGWRKRLACIAAFVVIPVILNGLRVYFTILVSHWTDMRYGPGYEHVTFGRIFFIATMVLLFWLGRRWHDVDPPTVEASAAVVARSQSWTSWWPLPLAILVALAAPLLLNRSMERAGANLADTSRLVRLPVAANAWGGPFEAVGEWRPLYRGGLVERQARYDYRNGGSVDVFVAAYGLGNSLGAEMISYRNIIATGEHKSLASEALRRIDAADGSEALLVRELTVTDGDRSRLVWYWFVVGDRPVASNLTAKALEALLFVTGGADSERIVALSTPSNDAAAQRLEAFVQAHLPCVVDGFQRESCAP